MKTKFLSKINSPADMKRLDYAELEILCREIRQFLIENVSKTGGHLASNLGMVEVTVAMHRMLSSPMDMFVFDVGHQCYTHKILTGRRGQFSGLRQKGGLSGFPAPSESPHDVFLAGHGSTSMAAAVGLARAKKIKNEPGVVVAIIGDGAFTGGMVYEALNNAVDLDNLVIVLNDNKMSISKNIGGLARYFGKLRTSPEYYKAKHDVKSALVKTPVLGSGLVNGIRKMKGMLRRGLYHSTMFDELGVRYIGPLDGHNIPALCSVFGTLGEMHKPVLIHIDTIKGKGFAPAERNPGAFHGVSAFDYRNVPDPDIAPENSFSTVFGRALKHEAETNERICGVVAAMTYGTGMQYFKKAFRARFFDVGMAEGMSVTFAAGLARSGLLPVVCVYSTFLQRAYDQIIHDVMLQNLDVLFAIDRAGFVPGDGETHQGLYDAAYLSQQSDMPIVSPANYAELGYWLPRLLSNYSQPRAIRYPRGSESEFLSKKECVMEAYARVYGGKRTKADLAFVSYGAQIEETILAATQLKTDKIPAHVYQLLLINPLPEGVINDLVKYKLVVFVEEGIARGGIGEHMALQLYNSGFKGKFVLVAAPEVGIDHATVSQLKEMCGLDANSLAQKAKQSLREKF